MIRHGRKFSHGAGPNTGGLVTVRSGAGGPTGAGGGASTTATNNNNVLAALIVDLQALGLIA